MKIMKDLNRELSMEELEGVIGGVSPQEMMLEGQIDERILEWMTHRDPEDIRRELMMRRGPRRRVLANGIFRDGSDWRSRILT